MLIAGVRTYHYQENISMNRIKFIPLFLAVTMLALLPAFALAEPSPSPEVTPSPTAAPTVEPTAEPSASPTAEPTPSAAPEASPTPTQAPSGKDYRITYKGGNSFSTNNSATPTSVEIDGKPVSFIGDGKNFTVSCIKKDAQRITVRWNSTSVSISFKPDANISCSSTEPPKTGDVSVAAASLLSAAAAAGVAVFGRKK